MPVRELEYTPVVKKTQPSTLNRAAQGREWVYSQVGLELTGPSSETLVPELKRLVRHAPWWGQGSYEAFSGLPYKLLC